MDGMRIAITAPMAMKQYQELQVENGLGAACMGRQTLSGMFDFVLKTSHRERTLTLLEQDSRSVGTLYGDAGRPHGPA